MFFLYFFLLSLFLLTAFVMSSEPDDLSATNKFTQICNSTLSISVFIGWFAIIVFGLVEYVAIFIIALVWSVALIVASVITISKNLFFGIGNLVCWVSYLVLLISCCNNYETPNLSPAIEYGRYCYVDRGAYCNPIIDYVDNFTVNDPHASFRTVCGICNRRYSNHFHKQYTKSEYDEKCRQDSLFAEYLISSTLPLPY